MLIFVVSIILVFLILILKLNFFVLDFVLDSIVLIFFCVICDGYWLVVLSIDKGNDNCLSCLLLYLLIGLFFDYMWSVFIE